MPHRDIPLVKRASTAKGSHLLPNLQLEARFLATAGVPYAQNDTIPFATEVGELGVLIRHGLPYMGHSQAMEAQFEALAAPMPTMDALLSLHGSIA